MFLLVVLASLNLYFHFSFEGTINERGRWIDQSLLQVVSPVQKSVVFVKTWTGSKIENFSELVSAQEENTRLKQAQSQIEFRLQKFEEVEKENERLRALIGFKQSQRLHLKASRIIARDISLFQQSVTLNVGTDDGVEKGLAVVSTEGVVGRILRANASDSIVLLVSDLNSRMDGVIERSRNHVIVGGTIAGELKLEYLRRRADIQIGDMIVSAGTGSVFPSGFKIGRVISKAQDPNLVLEEASLESAVNMSRIEEVFVVLGSPKVETSRGP